MLDRFRGRVIPAYSMTLLTVGQAYSQATKPTELKEGITTFTSGPASVFGVPGKAAAELSDRVRRKGSLNGVKLVPIFIDEGGGGEQAAVGVPPRRPGSGREGDARLDLEPGTATRDCARGQDLEVLNIMWDCATERSSDRRSSTSSVRRPTRSPRWWPRSSICCGSSWASTPPCAGPGTTPTAAIPGRSSAGTAPRAEARHEDRRRAVSEVRRSRLFDRDHAPAGTQAEVILSTSWRR